jgi:hypothetical protein
MRTKTDYREQIDSNGNKMRLRIGLAPVQARASGQDS